MYITENTRNICTFFRVTSRQKKEAKTDYFVKTTFSDSGSSKRFFWKGVKSENRNSARLKFLFLSRRTK